MATQPLPRNLPNALLELIDAGKKFAVVIVLKDAGSTPRKAGTKAIVDEAGEIQGTIGGGLLESKARRAAVEAIRKQHPVVYDFPFAGASARGDDPVCGGTMRILVDPNPSYHQDTLRRAADDLAARRRGVLMTIVGGADLLLVETTWFAGEESPPWGDPSVRAAELARSGGPARYFAGRFGHFDIEGLAELIVPAPLLLIAGGGHVARALARQASLLDFEVALMDDRPEFADPAQYPASVDVRCGRFGELASRWPLNRDTYVAIVGRGHKVDADALAAVIKEPVGYVGMMGSRRKVALIRKEFIESGVATEEQFARVHAPIGLDLGAETVEEIAASIVAELVAVRRGKAVTRGRTA